jgi:SulP family sulfate permease
MLKIPERGFIPSVGENLNPGQLLPNLMAGLLVGIGEIIFAISIGSLIFSGELLPFLPYGIGIALVTAAVTMISISLLSSIKGVIGSLQDSSSVILALIVASLVAGLTAMRAEVKIATVVVIISLTSLLTGIFLLALGYFKLGGLVRFIPYPVVGGFLAGTGWLLVQGSIGVMADHPLTLSNIDSLLQPRQLILWLPGVIFAIVLFLSLHRIKHYLIMPGVLIGAILLFYLFLLMTGTTIYEATQRGLLLGDALREVNWQPLHIRSLIDANWSAILGQLGNISIILILSSIALLMNTSALELSRGQDINLNHELQSAGVANILSGLFGGMIGYHALNASTLSARIGARSRFVGILAGALCLVVLFAGTSLLVYFPKLILGGLLLFLGIDFLYDWVIMGWSKLTTIDYLVVILILSVIATTGFLAGVAVGLAVMIVLFVINYSRVEVVRHELSGIEMSSNVERCDRQRQALKKFGKHVFILELQGFIFFGTANALLERIRTRLSNPGQLPVRYIILDFERVSGLDSSAVFSFTKCRQIAADQGIELVFTGLMDKIYRQLEIGGLFEGGLKICVFPDLDRGLEYCEERLLEEVGVSKISPPATLGERLVSAGFQETVAARLIKNLEQVDVEQGGYLAHQGEKANDLYFIEGGKLSIYLEIEDEGRIRLQTLGTRTVVGELGLYLDTTRTASIIADEPSVVYRLTRSALLEIKNKDPELAAALHEFVACLLAERLADTTGLIARLNN